MGPSRRNFLRQSLTASTVALTPLGCKRHNPQAVRSSSSRVGTSTRFEPAYIKTELEGRLKRIEEELWDSLRSCRCCPRECEANRLEGEQGVCSSTTRLKVYSAGPHFGEESPLVGRGGSGTVFFSNCNLLCRFCQNWEINHRGDGRFVSHDSLADMMLGLQKRGCHNINLVTPTHVVPHIVKALRIGIVKGLRLPLVYNTGGYDSLEIVKKLDGIIDIYLPDFKYQDGDLAAKYSSGASDYPNVAARAIKEMYRQVGDLVVDDRGIALRGLMVRHLVMPNNIAGTDRFVRWVASELSPDTYVNIMAQYRPEYEAFDYPEIARRLTAAEWSQAMQWARKAGIGDAPQQVL